MAAKLAVPATDKIAPLVAYLGLDLSGDLGPYTVYTNARGRVVFYPRSPPTKPPSAAQRKQRQRFRAAQQQWSGISAVLKAQWERLVNANRLCLTGQNLYMSLALRPDDDGLATANNRANLSLTPPTPIPL